MFNTIKEFFVGKPKVEEKPAECPYKAEPAPEPVVEPAPVVEEIKITTVTLSDQITDAVSYC